MAFNMPAANNNTTGNINENWKAQAFINIWVGGANGTRKKIGSIPLRENKSFEAALIKRLQEDGAVEAMIQALEIDFQMADKPVSDVGF